MGHDHGRRRRPRGRRPGARDPAPPGAAACARGQRRPVPGVVRAAAHLRAAHGHGAGRPRVPGSRQPRLAAAGGAGGVRRPAGRRQLARRLLAPALPRPARPHRAERQLLLPVRGRRAGPGGAGSGADRGRAGLPDAARPGPASGGGAARVDRCRRPRPAPCSPPRGSPGARAGHGALAVRRASRAPGTCWCCTAVTRAASTCSLPTACRSRSTSSTAGLREVLARTATDAAPGTSVGHLTTQAREDWARNRQALLGLAPANARGARRRGDRAVLRVPGGRRARGRAPGLRPAAARGQREPLVRQGPVVRRVR